MNQLQEALGELRRAADNLFFDLALVATNPVKIGFRPKKQARISSQWNTVYDSMRSLESADVVNLPGVLEAPLSAIFRLLRNCIRGQEPSKAELEQLTIALNDSAEIGTTRETGLVYISRDMSPIKAIAEDVLRYVNHLAESPLLKPSEPIGVCVKCEGIYLKRRTNQEYCSPHCRFNSWASEKGNTYFAMKARESRAAKKAMARRKGGKTKDLSRKTVGISEVELLGKSSDTKGKNKLNR